MILPRGVVLTVVVGVVVGVVVASSIAGVTASQGSTATNLLYVAGRIEFKSIYSQVHLDGTMRTSSIAMSP